MVPGGVLRPAQGTHSYQYQRFFTGISKLLFIFVEGSDSAQCGFNDECSMRGWYGPRNKPTDDVAETLTHRDAFKLLVLLPELPREALNTTDTNRSDVIRLRRGHWTGGRGRGQTGPAGGAGQVGLVPPR